MRFHAMGHEENLLRINTAIRTCLDRCYSARYPLVGLAECLAELRVRPDWTMAEVEEVESTVRRILQAVVSRDPAGSLAHAMAAEAELDESADQDADDAPRRNYRSW